jgi:alpha-N-arabinofuranosidase
LLQNTGITGYRLPEWVLILAAVAAVAGCAEDPGGPACEENATCLYVDLANPGHKISPLLFGSQFEYLGSGTGVWDSLVTDYCENPDIPEGRPHQVMLDEFAQLGISILRYPSGIPSDFFHWNEAIGPIETRIPQINPWISTFDDIRKECPVFGPDEFVEYAGLLDATMLIVTNAGSGSKEEAAGWLDYYENNGVSVEYWEVGNELYIQAPEFLFSGHMPPQEYAATFNAHAQALRQVNPDIKVGVVMSPMDQDWNKGVMSAITEPFDFITLHSFQPQIDTCSNFSDEEVYKSLLASPLLLDVQIELIKKTARDLSVVPANRIPVFSVSEWGPWFLHPCDPGEVENDDARARSLGSALFSGLVFNSLFRDPDIFSAIHASLANLRAQATLNIVWDDTEGWVPIRSGFYFVQKLYFDSSGGVVMPTTIRNSPTFAAKLFDNTDSVEQPVLDSIAVLSEDESSLYVYIVNRSLTEDITLQLLIGNLDLAVNSVIAETLVASDITAMNEAGHTNAIEVVKSVLATSQELQLNLQAHTLMRLTFSIASN